MTREAIVLAGGLGTRLRSLLPDRPKVLAPIGEHPFLYYLLHYLAKQQIHRVILSLGYQHELVLQWLEKDCTDNFPFEIRPVVESYPLGTGGAIQLAMTHASANFVFILNGDTYFPIALMEMEQFHQHMQKPITLAACYLQDTGRYGRLEIDETQHVVKSFQEKQARKAGWINAGIYCINTNWWKSQSFPEIFSFEKEVLEPLLNHSTSSSIAVFQANQFFIDMGVPEDYIRAQTTIPAYAQIR
ncbi:MAG: NTP transferase domain-containing protein [Thermoflavifilum sp.]|nr:NTP transferase domain-containing protein [Thermoflavifilum sp.]